MKRVTTFSKLFPKNHPRSNEPTYFVEKIWKSLWDKNQAHDIHLFQGPHDDVFHPMGEGILNVHQFHPKNHTIRQGHRFKKGDTIDPRVWGNDINPKSGRYGPYQSKQIQIADEIEVKKIWDFQMIPALWLDECQFILDGKKVTYDLIKVIATNDGLDLMDFIYWFCGGSVASSKRKPFEGQIICWNEDIIYNC